MRDSARQSLSASFMLVVRPAAAAGDATEWTPKRLANEQHAQAVFGHQADIDVAATRVRIAMLERRAAHRPLDAAGIAAAILFSIAIAALLSFLVGVIAIELAAATLAFAIGPGFLARSRRAELERRRRLVGCGQADCPDCYRESA